MLIDIDDLMSWPCDVVTLLRECHPRLCYGTEARPHFADYADLAAEVGRRLVSHSVLAWHCTRLCPDEIEAVKAEGMLPLSAETLCRRVRRRVDAGDISAAVAEQFMPDSLARFEARCGRLHFALTRKCAAAWGAGGLLSLWGGEAVFGEHAGGAEATDLLGRLGVPCVVEMAVPIASLSFGVGEAVLSTFHASSGPCRDRIDPGCSFVDHHLGPDAVRRIITLADPGTTMPCPTLDVEHLSTWLAPSPPA